MRLVQLAGYCIIYAGSWSSHPDHSTCSLKGESHRDYFTKTKKKTRMKCVKNNCLHGFGGLLRGYNGE
jgi:hypothetical protein